MSKTQLPLRVNLTPNQWQLYSDYKQSGLAAYQLNKKFTKLLTEAEYQIEVDDNMVNAESAAIWLRDKMYEYMETPFQREHGASDTEPQWVVVDLINKILETNISRWD